MDGQADFQTDDILLLDEAVEAPPIVRFDERRMHIRAYNYWASLLGDRNLPTIESLNPAEIEDFGSHSVLLDFTRGLDDPAIAFLGSAIAAQCGITGPVERIGQIPPRTLLSRLTDHYLQIIANAAPIGFEAEFTNQRGDEILYRGIMMPFSSDDETIDFVYGVINWKEMAADTVTDNIVAEIEIDTARNGQPTMIAAGPVWGDDNVDLDLEAEDDALELTLDHQIDMADAEQDDASLDDRLAIAREAAAAATASEGRTRHALYRAIGLAHAFAVAARSRPDDYALILEEAGIVVQERSPLTALAKLIFGTSYDKTRLAEFVCAIDYALAQDLAPGALIAHLHGLPGGLKALVAAVRAAKRGEEAAPAEPPRALAKARRVLSSSAAIDIDTLEPDESGLAIVVMRREADGSYVPVATLDTDDRLSGRVLAAAARGR
jgi:hypothetical protein